MSDEPSYETQRIDHLGIVAGISREIGLVETIDQKVGESGRKVSCGEATLAMIQNALGFSSRVYYLRTSSPKDVYQDRDDACLGIK